jgi:hypothetical protein
LLTLSLRMQEPYLRRGMASNTLDYASEVLDEAFSRLLALQRLPFASTAHPAHRSLPTYPVVAVPGVGKSPVLSALRRPPPTAAATSSVRCADAPLAGRAPAPRRPGTLAGELDSRGGTRFPPKRPMGGAAWAAIPREVIDGWLKTEPEYVWLFLIAERARDSGREVDAEAAEALEKLIFESRGRDS